MKDSGACGEYISCAILASHIIIGAIFLTIQYPVSCESRSLSLSIVDAP